MKKIIILAIVVLVTAAFSNISAQVTPAGAGDKDLRDTNIKIRSNELERIDREAKKEAAKKEAANKKDKSAEQPKDELAAKYDEIKTDYEQIQMSQDAIIKAYQSGDKTDYAQIGKSASEINRSAIRLNSNLFSAPAAANTNEKKEVKKEESRKEEPEKETKTTKSVSDLIIDLDNTIGSFATSPMFQNLRSVDPQVSAKAKTNLEKIIELSATLGTEAGKKSAE